MTCVCNDHCGGIQGGPGCTSEPAPHGGYRPPYLAARALSAFSFSSDVLDVSRQPWGKPLVIAAETISADPIPSLSHRDPGDEDDGRGDPCSGA